MNSWPPWSAALRRRWNNPTAWLWHAVAPDGRIYTFGEHYRSVLASPAGSDHANIRALLAGSLDAVHFEQAPPLRRRG